MNVIFVLFGFVITVTENNIHEFSLFCQLSSFVFFNHVMRCTSHFAGCGEEYNSSYCIYECNYICCLCIGSLEDSVWMQQNFMQLFHVISSSSFLCHQFECFCFLLTYYKPHMKVVSFEFVWIGHHIASKGTYTYKLRSTDTCFWWIRRQHGRTRVRHISSCVFYYLFSFLFVRHDTTPVVFPRALSHGPHVRAIASDFAWRWIVGVIRKKIWKEIWRSS